AVPAALSAAGRDRANPRFQQPGADAIADGTGWRTRFRCRAVLPGRGRRRRGAHPAVPSCLGCRVLVVRRPPGALRAIFLGRPVAACDRALPELRAQGFAQAARVGLYRARRARRRRPSLTAAATPDARSDACAETAAAGKGRPMDFGLLMMPSAARAAEEARVAEACGFSHCWAADSELMAADPYVVLAAAALATKRIVLGTGVAVAGTRIAPVTACAVASVNSLAPGRVVLGVGTGNSARRAMGLAPYRVSELREHVRVVRGLLGGGAVEYHEGAERRMIRLFHQDLQLVNSRDRVPIYIAGNAPRATELAGEAGRWAMVALHALYEGVQQPAAAPASSRAVFAAYKEYADRRFGDNPQYYLELHD